MDSSFDSSSSSSTNTNRDSSAENDESVIAVAQIDPLSHVQLRAYQRIMFERSLHSNLMVTLPTGTGKTLIAIYLIKNKLHQTDGPYPEVARRTVFMAPTRALVDQQCYVIQSMIPTHKVAKMHGDDKSDFFKAEDWKQFLAASPIICFTPATLKDAIYKGYVNFHNLNLMIFDEVHHVVSTSNKVSNHQYRQLMDLYRDRAPSIPTDRRPRILGLSASVFSTKIKRDEVKCRIRQIEEVMHAKLDSDDTATFVKEANVFVIEVNCKQNEPDYRGQLGTIWANAENCELFDRFYEMLEGVIEQVPLAKHLKSAIGKVQRLFIEMGPRFAIDTLELYKESLERPVKGMIEAIPVLVPLFSHMQKIIGKQKLVGGKKEIKMISPKLVSLLNLLESFKESLNCIIFVKERLEASLIYRWLQSIAATEDKYSFIKPGFICGAPTKAFIRFSRNTLDFKRLFEEKQLNVMIATSVLEEGIDVPICNLVIRYNFPENFRAFIQSKGRARDKDSYFLLLIDRRHELTHNWQNELNEYHLLEQFLKNPKNLNLNYSDEVDESEEDGTDSAVSSQFFIGPRHVTKSGAEISERNASAILHQYLQCLPSDFFTESKPIFRLLRKPVNEKVPNGAKKYAYVLIWPINCSMNGIVKGEYRNSIKGAKVSCAFAACKALYERGEVGEHLNVVSKEFLLSKHETELNLKSIITDPRSITDKTSDLVTKPKKELELKHSYDRVVIDYRTKLFASSSIVSPKTHLYLYVIEFTNFYSLFEASESEVETIGFVTPIPLSTSCSVIDSLIYLNQNRIKCSTRLVEPILHDKPTLELIQFFHSHVTENVIRKPRTKPATQKQADQSEHQSAASNFYLVPIKQSNSSNQYEINLSLINRLLEWHHQMEHHNKSKTSTFVTKESVAESFSPSTLFTTFHKSKLVIYIVKSLSNVLPTASFELSSSRKRLEATANHQLTEKTYVQYYLDTYKFEIKHTQVPMLHASFIESTLKRYWKFAITYKVPKEAKHSQIDAEEVTTKQHLFPPEFALNYPLPLPLFRMFNAFPPIAYRLEQFLIAEQFIAKLNGEKSTDYEQSIDIESLLTEQTYQNQTKSDCSKSGSEKQLNSSSNQVDQLQLVNVENLKVSSKSYLTSANSPTARLICQLPLLLQSLNVEIDNQQEQEADVDELFDKLGHLLPRMKELHFGRGPLEMTRQQENLQYGSTSALMFVGDIEPHIGQLRFDTFDRVHWPNPWYIAKAFTLARAADIWSLEQLETVGDSFLKASTALFLYFRYPAYDEGKLSQLKTALICNDNLSKLARDRDEGLIARYIMSDHLMINQNWFVSFYVTSSTREALNKPNSQSIKNKSLADCVEALIGACCLFGSGGATVHFLQWLGMVAFDPARFIDSELRNPVRYYQLEYKSNFDGIEFEDQQDLEMVRQRYEVDLELMVSKAYDFGLFGQVEEVIGYEFRQRYFLVQAFTHPSYTTIEYAYQNHIASYQRLEFIGDAILDYAITYFVYRRNQQLSPSEITQVRAALVNNTFYASIVVKYNLHKYLRSSSVQMATQIACFVRRYQCQLLSQFGTMINEMREEQECATIDEIDVPKALADIFEALVGAIYIDNGFSLDAVWRVVYKMIKVELDHFVEHIPTNPLAWLERTYANRYKFGDEAVQVDDQRKKIELTIEEEQDDQKLFIGFGQTKKQCKLSAAKRAMAAYSKSDSK